MGAIRRLASLTTDFYIRRRTPTIVYSLERTGSTTLYESLRQHGEMVIVTHYMAADPNGEHRLSGSARWVLRHVIGKRRKFRVITLVRDPIDNMLSTFARFSHDRVVRETGNPAAMVGDIASRFEPDFLAKGGYRHQLDWFDQFSRDLGVDVYKHPFDKEVGFGRIAAGPCEILILRTELDDDRKGQLVADFLEDPTFRMSKDVVFVRRKYEAPGKPGEAAAYGQSYKALKSTAEIPDEHWDVIRASKYARHFFTAEALEVSRARYVRARMHASQELSPV